MEAINHYKFLSFIPFCELFNWSVQYMSGNRFGYADKYTLVKIGTFLSRNKTPIEIEDEKEYKRVTIKTNNGGVFLRDLEKGENIGTKKQFLISKGQFLLSKIDARNGAFGVVPEKLDGSIVTNDFPSFDINGELINPTFLLLIITTKAFVNFAQSCSSGTTNRKRIDVELFLQQKIPLPSLDEQNQLIFAYNQKLASAEKLEKQASKLENGIEAYLMDTLGINISKMSQSKSILSFYNYVDIVDRWDMYNIGNTIFSALLKTKYKSVEIGNIYHFINRGWKKQEKTFRYIEIGSVDSLNGITESVEIQTKNAPSRATQKVCENDLIIGTTRPYLKKFAMVDKLYDDCVCSSGFQVIAPDKEYNLNFLHEYLLTKAAVLQFEFYMTGALYPAITSRDLRKIQIPLPPLSIQNEIVNQISTEKKKIKKLKTNAEDLRKEALAEFEKAIFE